MSEDSAYGKALAGKISPTPNTEMQQEDKVVDEDDDGEGMKL